MVVEGSRGGEVEIDGFDVVLYRSSSCSDGGGGMRRSGCFEG